MARRSWEQGACSAGNVVVVSLAVVFLNSLQRAVYCSTLNSSQQSTEALLP